MKSLKVLMMVALTILSVSLFAQTSTERQVKVSEQKSAKANYTCPMGPDMIMDKFDMCPKNRVSLNLSLKEKLKMDVMKIYSYPINHEITGVTGNMPCELPGTALNLSPKEKMKMYTHPVNTYVTIGKVSKCPECGMEMGIASNCPMNVGKTSDKASRCPICRTTLNLSPKEKMKMDMIKI